MKIDPALFSALAGFGPTGALVGLVLSGASAVADAIVTNAAKNTIPTPEEWETLKSEIQVSFKDL